VEIDDVVNETQLFLNETIQTPLGDFVAHIPPFGENVFEIFNSSLQTEVSSPSSALSAGAISAIVVAVVLASVGIAVGAWYFWRLYRSVPLVAPDAEVRRRPERVSLLDVRPYSDVAPEVDNSQENNQDSDLEWDYEGCQFLTPDFIDVPLD